MVGYDYFEEVDFELAIEIFSLPNIDELFFVNP
jgi:hypothetical protein